ARRCWRLALAWPRATLRGAPDRRWHLRAAQLSYRCTDGKAWVLHLRPPLYTPGGATLHAVRAGRVHSRERDAVLEALLAPRYHYGVPRIVVQDVVNNTLYLEHLDRTTTFLDLRFATQTLAYMAEIWRHPVDLLA